jgi:ParB family chromosome partitioning protein
MATKKMGLGKGLGALIPEMELEESKTLLYCGIEEIRPNRSQPRKHFDESKLQELADSIKEKGILEPLIVRKAADGYELVVGERRWRAAQKAGLREVPVLVKELEDREVLEALSHREFTEDDLNPLKKRRPSSVPVEEFEISQEDLGARLEGPDHHRQYVRLLKLPSEVKDQLLQNRISSGHARRS